MWEIGQILEREYGREVGRHEAKEQLQILIDLGLIEGFRGIGFAGEQRPIPRDELLKELDVEWNWVPTGEEYVRVAASDLGEEEYYVGDKAWN